MVQQDLGADIRQIVVAARGERVYVGWDGAAHVKIGNSTDLQRRGGELRIRMIFSFAGDHIDERRVLRMWRAYSVGGEWHWPGSALVCWCHCMIDSDDVRIECGDRATAHKLVSEMYRSRWRIAA